MYELLSIYCEVAEFLTYGGSSDHRGNYFNRCKMTGAVTVSQRRMMTVGRAAEGDAGA